MSRFHLAIGGKVGSPIQRGFRKDAVEDISAALERVATTGTGKVIVIDGAEGVGKTTLLALALTECKQAFPKAAIYAGDFSSPANPGQLTMWDLPRDSMEAGDLLTIVGQALSAVAGAAAIADPTGFGRVATAVSAFAGQAVQTAGAVHQVASKMNYRAGSKPPRQSAQELLEDVASAAKLGHPVVVALDDMHLAPQLEWCALFLSRWMVKLLDKHPVLLLVGGTGRSDSGRLSEHATEYAQAIARLHELGITHTKSLTLLGRRDIEAWLGDVEYVLTEDLLSLSGGHPGWAIRLFAEYRKHGIAKFYSGRDSGWRYSTNGRDEAKVLADTYLQTLLSRTVHGIEAYDRALRVLQSAALEGRVFTTEALAVALGEDHDELVDWIDENLIAESGSGGLISEVGFLDLPARSSSGSTTRSLLIYRFNSSVVWYALHPFYGELASDRDALLRELCPAYIKGLASAYQGSIWMVARRASDLARLVEDEALARHFELLGDSVAPRDVYIRLVREEVASFRSRKSVGADEALRVLRRLTTAYRALEGATLNGEDLEGAILGFDIATAFGQSATVEILAYRAEAADALGRIAFTRGWYGDAIRFTAHASELFARMGDYSAAALADLVCGSAMSWCMGFARQGSIDYLEGALAERIRPGSVSPGRQMFVADPNQLDTRLMEENFHDVLDAASVMIAKAPGEHRPRLLAQRSITLSRFHLVRREYAEAVSLLRYAVSVLDDKDQMYGEAMALLGSALWLSDQSDDAIVALRGAVRNCVQLGRRARTASILLELGHALAKVHRGDEALLVYKQAALLAARTRMPAAFHGAAVSLGGRLLNDRELRIAGVKLLAIAVKVAGRQPNELLAENSFEAFCTSVELENAVNEVGDLEWQAITDLLVALLNISLDGNESFLLGI
jgi:tetratricopeptide (TPR) repeat protein